jgi:hypothetical protein
VNRPDLASPVVELFGTTMHLPDPSVVYAVLGAVAANRLPGDPLWLLLVGPPSSGKTETLDALCELPEYHGVSTFSEAGLLAGSTSKDGGASGGLLRQLGDRGLIVTPDFGTLLNEHGSTRGRVFACLREVFDGRLVRRLGTEGGRTFRWRGHAGFVGAVTEAIDSPHVDLGLLGERFVYFRLPTVTAQDEYEACMVVDHNAGRQSEIRAQRSATVRSLFDAMTIPDHPSPIADDERDRLVTLANLGARCRSAVVRDGYTREVEVVPGHERSPRLYGQLRQLHAGLMLIGAPPEVLRKVLAKAALDGVHPGRRAVMEFLLRTPGMHATASVAGHCRLTETPTRRHLQDLMAHGVVELVGERPELWCVSDWLRERWWAVDDELSHEAKTSLNVLPLRRESIGDLADTEEVLSW